jgi:hypothetical protein
MPAQQNAQHHTALDPLTHFTIMPIFVVNAIASIWITANQWPDTIGLHLLWVAVSFALILLNMKTRLYALRNQDRLIRLEERLRLTALLPAAEHASIHALTTRQLIALRFASDGELPGLARRALAEELTSRQIKEAILTWRPDYDRV